MKWKNTLIGILYLMAFANIYPELQGLTWIDEKKRVRVSFNTAKNTFFDDISPLFLSIAVISRAEEPAGM